MSSQPDLPSSTPRAAQRRHITLLFSDLSGSTPLVEGVDAERYYDFLVRVEELAQAIVRKHGGTLLERKGDGFFAMFGFPESSEHDGRCATEAALEIHKAIAAVPAPSRTSVPVFLSMHSGIHSGLVLLREDEEEPSGFRVVGAATSTACRLSDAAKSGEILVSATTLGTESTFFRIDERREIALQGKAELVTVYRVVGREPIATRFQARMEHGLTPFAGRTRELALLERALRAAINGHLQMVSIIGDPGIGKTRLVREFLQSESARACDVHHGYCEDHRSAEPLQPFRQMFRSMFAASLPVNVATGVRELVSSLSATRPLIVFIDDWQWADDASRQVLAAIRELGDRPILILTTSRPTEADAAPIDAEVRLVLAPLHEDDAAATIQALRPTADPFTIRRIQDMSGGNPLFIEELCHSAPRELTEKPLDRASGQAWLSTLIESRIGRLPVEQGELVRTAAIVGMVVPAWLLEQLTGYGEDHPLVRELAERDIVFAGEAEGTLRFKHGITRKVIYDSVGLRRREELHLRVAQLLEERSAVESGEDLFEVLAYHYSAAGRPAQAADYAERAGDKALAAAALDRARTQYSAALELLEPSDDDYRRWVSIAQRLGLACVYDPGRDQLVALERAVDLALARGDQAALARAQYWVGYIHYALGDLTLAIQHCEQARTSCAEALAAARTRGDGNAAVGLEAHGVQILATLGQARAAACEYHGVLEQLDEALLIKRRHRSSTRPAVGSAYTLACRGAVLGDLGRFSEAHESFAEAINAVGEGNQPVKGSILAWQGGVYAWQRRWQDALVLAAEAQHIGERVESLYVLAISQALGGYARWKLEHASEAIDTMERAVSWLDSRHKRLFISVSYGWLAEAKLYSGRHLEARAYVARAIRRARQRDRFGEAMAYRVMARMPAELRSQSPEYSLERAMASARARQSPHEEAVTLMDQAEATAAAGRTADAAALAARARALLTALHMDPGP